MSVHESLVQAARQWLKSAATLTDAQVIPGDEKGPRPAPPYLTVTVIALDIVVGEDEYAEAIDGAGLPVRKVRGLRAGALSVQGFGDATDWLTTATLKLKNAAIKAALDAAGFTITARAGMTNLSALRDTAIEARHVREFDVSYMLNEVVDAPIEMQSASFAVTIRQYPGDPAPIVKTIVVSPP